MYQVVKVAEEMKRLLVENQQLKQQRETGSQQLRDHFQRSSKLLQNYLVEENIALHSGISEAQMKYQCGGR